MQISQPSLSSSLVVQDSVPVLTILGLDIQEAMADAVAQSPLFNPANPRSLTLLNLVHPFFPVKTIIKGLACDFLPDSYSCSICLTTSDKQIPGSF